MGKGICNIIGTSLGVPDDDIRPEYCMGHGERRWWYLHVIQCKDQRQGDHERQCRQCALFGVSGVAHGDLSRPVYGQHGKKHKNASKVKDYTRRKDIKQVEKDYNI